MMKKYRVLIAILLGCIVVSVTGVAIYRQLNAPKRTEQKIIYDGKEKTQEIKEGLINIPKDAKSFVCETISSELIGKILDQEFNAGKVSMPDTKTAEGEVSACAYESKEKNNTSIGSLIITQRRFNDATKAKQAYGYIIKVPSEGRKKLSETAHYESKAMQLINLTRSTLTTVSIGQATETVDDTQYRRIDSIFR